MILNEYDGSKASLVCSVLISFIYLLLTSFSKERAFSASEDFKARVHSVRALKQGSVTYCMGREDEVSKTVIKSSIKNGSFQ